MSDTVAAQRSIRDHEAPPRAGRRQTRAVAPIRARGVPVLAQAAPPAPPLLMVYRTRDGGISHARCGRLLEFQGRRAEIELDFFCRHCMEHVTLPDCVLSRVPLGEPILAA